MTPDFLQTLWFGLIAVLWVGYFILEGFDFGVGALLRVIGRSEAEKRAIIHTIGPVWDGNEVWVITAGGATFAAFPGWYASLFSGFYLALLLILLCLIARGVSFEFWGKDDSPRWRAGWEWATVIGSGGAALLWGVGWADIIHGVPMDAAHNVTATLWDLLHPYALLGGLVTLSLFLTHGANFLALRTTGELTDRARAVARRLSPVATLLLVGFLAWTAFDQPHGPVKISAQVPAVLAGLAALAATYAVQRRKDVAAFGLLSGAIALLFVSLVFELFPYALPSTTSHAFSLSLVTASSHSYTLTVMTVVAVVMVPIVLAYTGWTYWVFRARLGASDFAGEATPLAGLQRKLGGDPAGGDGSSGAPTATG
ncbi:MAG: cytochrome d ubiquinol oxidase subunit II [Solirubrobacteraceae bacterium]|jgi:cytochrome d ubiquinol oxidase subunit II